MAALSLMIYALNPPCAQYMGILTFPTPPSPQTKITYKESHIQLQMAETQKHQIVINIFSLCLCFNASGTQGIIYAETIQPYIKNFTSMHTQWHARDA